MSVFTGRHSPPSSPVSQSTPIETKENPIAVTIHMPQSAPVEGMPVQRANASAAKPQPAQNQPAPAQDQAKEQTSAVDDPHGCCFRGCWSCVGCACFGGFLGALFWARAATGH
ncbi:MAG: hypothetical protein V4609_03005 [Pseudomonadota bacterium]